MDFPLCPQSDWSEDYEAKCHVGTCKGERETETIMPEGPLQEETEVVREDARCRCEKQIDMESIESDTNA